MPYPGNHRVACMRMDMFVFVVMIMVMTLSMRMLVVVSTVIMLFVGSMLMFVMLLHKILHYLNKIWPLQGAEIT